MNEIEQLKYKIYLLEQELQYWKRKYGSQEFKKDSEPINWIVEPNIYKP